MHRYNFPSSMFSIVMFQRSGVLCFASATAKFKTFSLEGREPLFYDGKDE